MILIAAGVVEGIGLQAVGLGSGWALVAVFVILIYRGDLVPRRTYDDKCHDSSEWRAESRIKDAQLAEKDRQLQHMAEVGRTVDAIMRAMPHTADRRVES